MGFTADEMQKSFAILGQGGFDGDYAYDPQKDWGKRNDHDPWTWWHLVQKESAPHFTAWANDFAGKPLTLKSFHITFNYNGETHKPVHVYYALTNGKVQRTGVDAKRAGASEQQARDAYFNNRWAYDSLAQAFVDKVFGVVA